MPSRCLWIIFKDSFEIGKNGCIFLCALCSWEIKILSFLLWGPSNLLQNKDTFLKWSPPCQSHLFLWWPNLDFSDPISKISTRNCCEHFTWPHHSTNLFFSHIHTSQNLSFHSTKFQNLLDRVISHHQSPLSIVLVVITSYYSKKKNNTLWHCQQ